MAELTLQNETNELSNQGDAIHPDSGLPGLREI